MTCIACTSWFATFIALGGACHERSDQRQLERRPPRWPASYTTVPDVPAQPRPPALVRSSAEALETAILPDNVFLALKALATAHLRSGRRSRYAASLRELLIATCADDDVWRDFDFTAVAVDELVDLSSVEESTAAGCMFVEVEGVRRFAPLELRLYPGPVAPPRGDRREQAHPPW